MRVSSTILNRSGNKTAVEIKRPVVFPRPSTIKGEPEETRAQISPSTTKTGETIEHLKISPAADRPRITCHCTPYQPAKASPSLTHETGRSILPSGTFRSTSNFAPRSPPGGLLRYGSLDSVMGHPPDYKRNWARNSLDRLAPICKE